MDVRHLVRGGLRGLPLFSAKCRGEAGSHRRAGRTAVSCSVVRSAGRRNRYAIQREWVVYYSLYMGRHRDVCHIAGGKEKEEKKPNGRKTQEQERPSIDKSSKNALRTIIFKEKASIRQASIGGARCCADGMEVRPYLDGSGCERGSFLSGFVCLHNSVYIII